MKCTLLLLVPAFLHLISLPPVAAQKIEKQIFISQGKSRTRTYYLFVSDVPKGGAALPLADHTRAVELNAKLAPVCVSKWELTSSSYARGERRNGLEPRGPRRPTG